MKKPMNYFIEKINQKISRDFETQAKLGATIKYLRKESEQTLSYLSKKHGVSISYLSKIENDLIKPNVHYIGSILDSLEINEDMVLESENMNDWYNKVIEYMTNKEDHKSELLTYVSLRNDFQSKLIEFSLVVKEKTIVKTSKFISLLMHNLDSMKPLELALFLFTMVEHNMNEGDFFLAAQMLRSIKDSYIINEGLKLWHAKLWFQLSVYSNSLQQVTNTYERYNISLVKHNMIDTIKKNREIYLDYYVFVPPYNYTEDLKKLYYRSYRISLVIYEEYDMFLALEKEEDVAWLLYLDSTKEEKLNFSTIQFKNNLFENLLKLYFQVKYHQNNDLQFLREMVFSSYGNAQHYHICRFYANRLIKHLSSKNKYKECFLVEEKLRQRDLENNYAFILN